MTFKGVHDRNGMSLNPTPHDAQVPNHRADSNAAAYLLKCVALLVISIVVLPRIVHGQCPPGEILDCNGNCAPADWVGDGFCDDGTYSWNGVPIYFNCAQFDCDAGDCELILDCNGNCAPADWVGDGFCDDGSFNYNGVPIYLNCEEFDFDDGDCGCPPGEIEDCNGNCAPADWVGDGYCDDGTYSWNGTPIYFNCPQFDDDDGDCSIPSAPTALSPGSSAQPGSAIATTTPTMAWTSVSGAESYQFYISEFPYGSNHIVYTSPFVSGTSFQVPAADELENGGLYRWNMVAVNANGESGVSNTLYFQVNSGCPEGEIEDCNGNCAPESWIGDGYCDDGSFTWGDIPIYLNCSEFDNDGGDCDARPTGAFHWPATDANGVAAHRITSDGQGDYAIYDSTYHAGIDIGPTPVGDQSHRVVAAAPGTVVAVNASCAPCFGHCSSCIDCGCGNGFGNYVILNHGNSVYSLYSHLNSVNVSQGQSIQSAGHLLGLMGSTGNSTNIHLHFEIRNFSGIASPANSFGYSDDVPDGEGYVDPRIFMMPFTSSGTSPVVVQVIEPGSLNVRSGPGTAGVPAHDVFAVLTQVQSGQRFVAHAENGGGSNHWYRIDLPNARGATRGWVAEDFGGTVYLQLLPDAPFGQVHNVGSSGLNVRKQPGTNQPHVTTDNENANMKVWDGQMFAVIEEQNVSGTTWYKIDLSGNASDPAGWVTGDFFDVSGDVQPTCPTDIVTSATFQPPGDGVVDGADLAYLLGEWGPNLGSLADIVTSSTFQPPPDGIVDGADLAVLLGAWGICQ